MSTPGNTVTIVIGARANTDQGFARVRTAVQNLGRSLNENFGAAGRSSSMSFMDRFRNVLSQGFASIGQSSSGLTQGLGNALSSAGSSPYIIAGVTTLVAAIAPVIGTLIGGAIILGVGGGLAGIGLMAAAKAKEVKDAFSKTKDQIKKTLSDAAEPLEPVLIKAANRVTKMIKKMGPELKDIFKDMAPNLSGFFDNVANGLERAAPYMKPVADGFNEIMKHLGPEVARSIEEIGKSLGELGERFKDPEIAGDFSKMIGEIIRLIPKAIDFIVLLIDMYKELKPTLDEAWEAFKKLADILGPVLGLAFKILIKYLEIVLPLWADFIGLISKGVDVGGEWLGKAVEKIKDFIDWVKKMKGKTVVFAERGMAFVKQKVQDAIDKIKGFKNKTISLAQRGASTVVNKVKDAIGWIKRFVGKTVNIGVSGVTGAIGRVRELINTIKNLVGKSVSIGVNFFKNGGARIADFLGFAHGGVVGAAATGGVRSSLTMVGEQGPELVRLPFGSTVHSNPDTMRMLGGSGGSSQPIVINLVLNGRVLAQELIDPLRGEVRRRGGLVQSVLGK
jgi:phage-related protein